MILVADKKQAAPVIAPIAIAPIGPTEPEAGVIATKPATAPEAMPNILGLPCDNHSLNIHANAAVAVEI